MPWTFSAGRNVFYDDRISFYAIGGYDEIPVAEGELRRFKLGGMFEFRLLPRIWKIRVVRLFGRRLHIPLSWRLPWRWTSFSAGIGG